MEPSWTVSRTDSNAVKVDMEIPNSKWEQWFLLRSDAHHDNPHCNRRLETKHLKQAKERGAGIIDTGDCFCAMQGKYDKRSDKSSLRPEHQCNDYLDALVRTAVSDYQPYAQHFVAFGKGNHEIAVKKNHETDLTKRLVEGLNDKTGSEIQELGYTGWITFNFTACKSKRYRRVLWFTHGYGGGGPVTQDTIQASRQMTYIEGVDFMFSGHVHRSWLMEFIRLQLNHQGKITKKPVWYLKLPTYKDSYGDGSEGFETERGHGPRPLGAWWLRFYYYKEEICFEIIKAD